MIINGAFSLTAFGQEGSRNLTAEYCANNWKVDPVRCAEYVPKNYQPSQSQEIQQNNIPSNTANDANRICPYGSYLGKDTFGNPACFDSHTNQFVTSPNIAQSTSNSQPSGSQSSSGYGTIAGIVIFIIIIAIIAGIAKSRGKSESSTSQTLSRRGWTDSQHKEIMARQGGVCAKCGEYAGAWQFHHKDGNRNNNDLVNAEGLCPNCHDRISRGLDD